MLSPGRGRITFMNLPPTQSSSSYSYTSSGGMGTHTDGSSDYSYYSYSGSYSYTASNVSRSASGTEMRDMPSTFTQPPTQGTATQARTQQPQQPQQPQLQFQQPMLCPPPRVPSKPQQLTQAKPGEAPRPYHKAAESSASYTDSYSSYYYSYSDVTDDKEGGDSLGKSSTQSSCTPRDNQRKENLMPEGPERVSGPYKEPKPIGSAPPPIQHMPVTTEQAPVPPQVLLSASQKPTGPPQPPYVPQLPLNTPMVVPTKPIFDAAAVVHGQGAAAMQPVKRQNTMPVQNRNPNNVVVDDSYSYSYSQSETLGSYSGSYTDDYYTEETGSYDYSYTETKPAPKEKESAPSRLAESLKQKIQRQGTLQKTGDDVNEPLTEGYSYSYSYSYSDESVQDPRSVNKPAVTEQLKPDDHEQGSLSIESIKSRKDDSFYGSQSYDYSYTGGTLGSKTESSKTHDPGTLSKSTYYTTGSLIDTTDGNHSLSDYMTYTGYSDEMYSSEEGITSSSESLDIPPPMKYRELVTLAAPCQKPHTFHSQPRSCVVPNSSTEDTVSTFLDHLAEIQTEFLLRTAPQMLQNGILGTSEVSSENDTLSDDIFSTVSTCSTVSATSTTLCLPLRHFTKKSVMFALRAVGVRSSSEQQEILRGVGSFLSRERTRILLDNHAHRCLTQRVMSMFTNYDKWHSGEVPLSIALEILAHCTLTQQSIGNIELSLVSQKGEEEIFLRVVQHPEKSAGSIPLSAIQDGRQRKIKANETVIRCGGEGWKYRNVAVCWNEESGDVFIGTSVVAKGVKNRNTATRVLRCIEALLYVCYVTLKVMLKCATHLGVLYVPLVTALLKQTVKGNENATSFLYETALKAVLCPRREVESLAIHRRLQERYLGEGKTAVLSETVASSNTMQDVPSNFHSRKRRELYSVIKSSYEAQAGGGVHGGLAGGSYFEVGLEKLRIVDAVPPDAKCYCLISVRRSDNMEWMTAATIPAVSVASAGKNHGFKWKFDRGSSGTVLIAAREDDFLYVEACYDVQESTGERSTWCLGHVIVQFMSLGGANFPLLPGNLYTFEPQAILNGRAVGASGGCCGSSSKKMSNLQAKSLSILVKRAHGKALMGLGALPNRCIVWRRHAAVMALMLEALMSARDKSSNPHLWFKQHQFQSCLTVASNPHLMDALHRLWEYTLKGKIGFKPKYLYEKHEVILSLTFKVAAVHNNISGDQSDIVDIVMRKAAMTPPNDMSAPLEPVFV